MDTKYLVYLHSLGITQNKLREIFENNDDYKAFFDALSVDVLKKYNISDDQIKKILDNKNKLKCELIDKKMLNLGVHIITINDENYPKLLKQISNPPYLLYVRGELGNDEFFSVVGSRKITTYAKKVGESIIPSLTKYFTIVSGGAAGCDTMSHKIALENKAKTIVVFGTGIDMCYPEPNRKMYEEIIKNSGAIISIFPIGMPGSAYSFPVRNEIVAGMSKGLLVLEAGEKSGTLITANLALDQGRDLFAIPGDIFNPNFVGTNNLIKTGTAKLVNSPDDILEEYNFKIIKTLKELTFENEIQETIYNLLKYNLSLSIDEFMSKTNYNYADLSLNLSMMELSSLIKKDAFGKYEIVV